MPGTRGARFAFRGEMSEGMADTAPSNFEPEIIAFCCEH
jgi:hypothetical protein